MRRLLFGAIGVLLLTACDDSVTPTSPVGEGAALSARGTVANLVDVIVVLEPVTAPGAHAANKARAGEIARGLGLHPRFTYGTALFGFAASVPEGRLNGLRNDPRVLYVELDGIASIPFPRRSAPRWCTPESTHPACTGDEEDPAPSGQTIPWGVTRVGGPQRGASGTAWIIDTGIDPNHADLNVDADRSRNFVQRGKNDWKDGHGHGTHVAGTVAAIDNDIDVVGVAAGATVVAVRVLDNGGSGAYSWVTAGVDYVADNAAAGDVANMSLGGPHNQALHDAIVYAANVKGVLFSVAAGNSGRDASGHEPAHIDDQESNSVFTISAIGSNDCLASWSNYGAVVDFAAPGVGVLSTKKGGGTTTMSGTSMAAPHVAGLLLLGSVGSAGTACSDPDGNADPIAHR